MKKTVINKLLCAALCVAMVAAMVTVPAFAAEGKAGPHEHQWVEKSTYQGYNCQLGNCWMYYEECSICGAQKQIAFRDYDGKVGQHQFTETTITTDCPNNPKIEKVCSICHQIEVTKQGGHNWVTVGAEKSGKYCTDSSTQAYKCADCGATKEEKTGSRGSHTFETVETKADCINAGLRFYRCTTCGFETNHQIIENPHGHKWTNSEGGHTVGRECSVCGIKSAATEHTWSGWKSTEDNHWRECTQCGTKDSLGAHSFNSSGKCTVCGFSKPVCAHEWVIAGTFGALNHKEKCNRCGETRSVACTASGTRTYCTDDQYCACGNKVRDGQARHNFGTWICHDDSHEHHCLNIGCQYVEGGAHKYQTVAGVVKCMECKFIDKSASVAHTHNFGAWTAGTNSCVARCTDPTCSALEAQAHSLGKADCTGHATCTRCGAVVSAPASSNHVGATEIRNAVAATKDKAGYTGDTYCLACNQVVTKGAAIPALTSGHTHSFTKLMKDASGHWYQCECGEKSGFAAHSGGSATCSTQASCSVCGERYGALKASSHVGGTRIEGAKAAEVGVAGYTGDVHCLGCGVLISKGKTIEPLKESHNHTYSLKSDSTAHWQECACGDKKDVTEHDFANGACKVCGAKEEKVEAHVHAFSAGWSSNGTSHWHQCATCGSVADMEEHTFVNDICAHCKMSYTRYEGLAHVEQDKKAAEAKLAGDENVATIFPDVAKDEWYTVHVQRVFDYGLMNGVGSDFGTKNTTSRIQVMTIIARINGVQDADSSDWNEVQKAAEEWAVGNGIAEEGSRSDAITRSELVLMLWRNAGKVKSDADLSRFADVDELTGETAEAMKWAVSVGVIEGSGNSDGRLLACPNDKASRAQIAKILTTYIDATAGDIIDVSTL